MPRAWHQRSEEHTSELQSLAYLVCRLLLEKKKEQLPRGSTVRCREDLHAKLRGKALRAPLKAPWLCSATLPVSGHRFLLFFFFNDTATTEIYTLSLHDALPIWPFPGPNDGRAGLQPHRIDWVGWFRSEEHTSELQSLAYLVCRLLLEKKKK